MLANASFDFENIIDLSLSAVPKNSDLVSRFLSGKTDTPRYVIGRNDESLAVMRHIKLDGIIDDYVVNLPSWRGVNVCKLETVPSDAIIVNCATSISPVDVLDNIRRAGFLNVINYSDLLGYGHELFPLPWFVSQQRAEWSDSKIAWIELYGRLEDDESRKTLLDVLRFRLTADPMYMQGYGVRLKDQYFEDFMQLRHETFVDAGGFDGDTTEIFCNRYPDYSSVLFFEPSPKNIEMAKYRLKNLSRVEFFQLGLSDQPDSLRFNADIDSASSISPSGSLIVEVAPLDDVITKPVSFIKMDLEGWELNALSGAKNHIRQNKPKLAIAVYHSASDFLRIPDFILGLNQNYRIYMRHYTQGWSETVMYFVPDSI